MLDDFFKYFKLSSKDIKVSNQVINLQELIRQLIEEEEPIFKDNNLKLSSNLNEEPINISGDSELIVRAINNILSNALKYTNERGKIIVSGEENNKENILITILTLFKRRKSSGNYIRWFFWGYDDFVTRNIIPRTIMNLIYIHKFYRGIM